MGFGADRFSNKYIYIFPYFHISIDSIDSIESNVMLVGSEGCLLVGG